MGDSEGRKYERRRPSVYHSHQDGTGGTDGTTRRKSTRSLQSPPRDDYLHASRVTSNRHARSPPRAELPRSTRRQSAHHAESSPPEERPGPSDHRSLQRRKSVKEVEPANTSKSSSIPLGQRARPGVRAVQKNKFMFSSAPTSRTSHWKSNTVAFNQHVFCCAVAAVARYHAFRGALALWNKEPPRTDEQLEDFLVRAVVKVTVREGPYLLEEAESCTQRFMEETGLGSADNKPKSRSGRSERDVESGEGSFNSGARRPIAIARLVSSAQSFADSPGERTSDSE
ncbi:UL49 tegument phosphoprotein [Meleagrid alphaherpesvirus 1]|uniref:Tegument protein VP22 n=1 Tax=Meleagrid herpesvirus 1 TaxID=37108 RepID=Q9DHC2_MEHV1|nr:tegument protein VP22 [Meleagrid alphaherpesvirus 1]AKQ48629.1 tegument protein VP22 [iBAC vector pMeHV1-C7]AKQ48701.1 tegument protein VP22 [iBAC vector pMeHV1-C9]AKQ48773.1 tegument protein VP22 [iBAC vector pMeHV1-C10]AKQ48845.1 tegument protein VP22 [iBAC vector pMeHV1-C17]AKQ48918.1 tegument protein VP22 [iBAC vector pMeHV1-C18]